MRESTIEKTVIDFATLNGCLTWKSGGPGDRGKPDRPFLKNGKIIFIEFKAPGKKPTALQKRWLLKLTEQNFVAEWCDNIEEGIALVKKYLLD